MTAIPRSESTSPFAIAIPELPIRVGLVGTGFVAKLRAETLLADERSRLVAVAGNTPTKTGLFAQTYQAEVSNSWQELLDRDDIDLVVICNVNREHGAIARSALTAGKQVVVEYPLSLDPEEAADLIALAQQKQLLLHVEHLELLGGVHLAVKQILPEAGEISYARYCTIAPQRNAPRRWTYNKDLFGFPLTAALSRLHRLTDLFGTVTTVSCQSRFWDAPDEPDYFTACLCSAQLRFANGTTADVIYGKGETFWKAERKMELYGDRATLIFDGDRGQIVRDLETIPIDVGSRRGLFAKDTTWVLDRLTQGKPLYVQPIESLYTLKIADAARRAAQTGEIVKMVDC